VPGKYPSEDDLELLRLRNVPSLRVNEKIAFIATGEVADGELIFQLHV
jgi:hypothetical protein